MILIKNEQNDTPINAEQIKQDAQKILDALDYSDFDLGILLTTNTEIQRLNKQYRDKDKATDILSFPFHTITAGERIVPKSADDKNLGDLIIAPEYVQNNLAQWNQTFEQRLRVLLVHGICHVLGYDHITDEDYKKMQEKESALLKLL